MLTNKNKHILDNFGDLLTILIIIITNRLYKDNTVFLLGVAWMGMNIVNMKPLSISNTCAPSNHHLHF